MSIESESTFDEKRAMALVQTMFQDMSADEFEARLQRANPKVYRKLKRQSTPTANGVSHHGSGSEPPTGASDT